jgi:hypothetical protein
MLYDELRGRRKSPLQERLCLVVHLRRQQLRFREIEITALGAINEANGKQVEAALEGYRKLLFPGMKDQKDEFLETAKKALAEEAKKVYLIKPKGVNSREAWKQAAKGGDPTLARMAERELRQEAEAQARLKARLKGMRKEMPRDAEKF